ncbi:MAG: hypothetical protein QOD27_1704 [Microbacteriaceae bacterium]|jgi:hypothetical protein|nr:hypothetical protein [Microbacteriaceae bacterium]MDQ1550046.1 hypothetical protein [Microbacteriaceae bacterium]
MGRFRTPVTALSALAMVALAIALVGCTPTAPVAKATASDKLSASSAPTPTPTPTPKPVYVSGGTAEQNKAYFDSVNSALITSNGTADGKTIVNTLVAAGFDKAAMQLTPDKTSIGVAADSVLFSVRLGDGCLIGQRGPAGYSSSIGPALTGGSCLVGKTRTINW